MSAPTLTGLSGSGISPSSPAPTIQGLTTTVSGAGQKLGPVAVVNGDQAFPGPTVLAVNSTVGFSSPGTLTVPGVGALAYTSATNTQFQGISNLAGSGTATNGTQVSVGTTLVVAATVGFPASGWLNVPGVTNPVYYGSIIDGVTFGGCYTTAGGGTATNGGPVTAAIPAGMDSGTATGNTQIATTASVLNEKLKIDVRDYWQHGDQGISQAIARAYSAPNVQTLGAEIIIPRGSWSMATGALTPVSSALLNASGLKLQGGHTGRVTIRGEGSDATTLKMTADCHALWWAAGGANVLNTLFGVEDLTVDAAALQGSGYTAGVLIQANALQLNLTKMRVRNVNVINVGNPAAHLRVINVSCNLQPDTPACGLSFNGVPAGMYLIQDVDIDNCDLGLIGGGGFSGVTILGFSGSDQSQGAAVKYSNPITAPVLIDRIKTHKVKWDAYPGGTSTGARAGSGIQYTADGISGHQEITSCWVHGSDDVNIECDAPTDLTIEDTVVIDSWNGNLFIANNFGSSPYMVEGGVGWVDPDSAHVRISKCKAMRISSSGGTNPVGFSANGRYNTVLPNLTFDDLQIVELTPPASTANPFQILGRAPRKIEGSVRITQRGFTKQFTANGQSLTMRAAQLQLLGHRADMKLHIHHELNGILDANGKTGTLTANHVGVYVPNVTDVSSDLRVTTSVEVKKIDSSGSGNTPVANYTQLDMMASASAAATDTFTGGNITGAVVNGAGQTFPTGTLNVVSTNGIPPSGTLTIPGVTGVVAYTAVTPTAFLNCTGGTGTATNGATAAWAGGDIATDYLLDTPSYANVTFAAAKLNVVTAGNELRLLRLQNNVSAIGGQIGPQVDGAFHGQFTPGATLTGQKGGAVGKWLEGNVPGSLPFTLSALLSTGAPITSLPANALLGQIPAGTSLTLTSGANTQTWTTSAVAAVGDVAIAVVSQTPSFAFPAGSTIAANNSWLEAYVSDNGTNSFLFLDKIVAGVRSTMLTNGVGGAATITPFALANGVNSTGVALQLASRIVNGTPYCVRIFTRGNLVTADYFANQSTTPTLKTAGASTLTVTLAGSDALTFGDQILGYGGLCWIPADAAETSTNSAWRSMCYLHGFVSLKALRTGAAFNSAVGVNWAQDAYSVRFAGRFGLIDCDWAGLLPAASVTEDVYSTASAATPKTPTANALQPGVLIDRAKWVNTPAPSTPAVATSTNPMTNIYRYPVDAYIYGGTVTVVQVTPSGGAAIQVANGTGVRVRLHPADAVTITYSVAPTVVFVPVV